MTDVENESSSLNQEPKNNKNRIEEDLTENNNISPSPDTRIIFDEEDSKGKITVSETIDKTKAYLSVACSSPEEKHSKEDIINVLTELGITTEIKEEEIETLLSNIEKQGDACDSVLIAEGQSPVHGKDSECEILFDQEEPYVNKGQTLIQITEPVSEKEGKDIYGNPIEPIHGFTDKLPERPVAGQNVKERKGDEFLVDYYAKTKGALFIKIGMPDDVGGSFFDSNGTTVRNIRIVIARWDTAVSNIQRKVTACKI